MVFTETLPHMQRHVMRLSECTISLVRRRCPLESTGTMNRCSIFTDQKERHTSMAVSPVLNGLSKYEMQIGGAQSHGKTGDLCQCCIMATLNLNFCNGFYPASSPQYLCHPGSLLHRIELLSIAQSAVVPELLCSVMNYIYVTAPFCPIT